MLKNWIMLHKKYFKKNVSDSTVVIEPGLDGEPIIVHLI